MEKLYENIKKLREEKPAEFNIQNFYLIADDDKYFEYVDNYLYSYVMDTDMVEDCIEERKFYTDDRITGVFEIDRKVTCIVPERHTMFDEMVSIHEIAHLINYLNNRNNDKSIYRKVIPFFNEYEFLKQINQFYADYYLRMRRNNAIECANKMNMKNEKDNLSYILAYLILNERKEDYNIDKLNKINTDAKKLDKALIRKGYTI